MSLATNSNSQETPPSVNHTPLSQNASTSVFNGTFSATPAYPLPPTRVSTLATEIQHLRKQLHEITIQRDAAERNSIRLQRENAVLRSKLNWEEPGDPGAAYQGMQPPMTTTWATPEGENWESAAEEPKAKKNKNKHPKSHSRALAVDRDGGLGGSGEAGESEIVLANPDTAVFSGSLWSYNTAAVRVIAHALSIPTTGIKPELVKRVSEHLDAHRELEADPRFAGLFTYRYRHPMGQSPAAKRPAVSENGPYAGPNDPQQSMYALGVVDPHLVPGPNQRRRIDEEGDDGQMPDSA